LFSVGAAIAADVKDCALVDRVSAAGAVMSIFPDCWWSGAQQCVVLYALALCQHNRIVCSGSACSTKAYMAYTDALLVAVTCGTWLEVFLLMHLLSLFY
jgi:hypothetical protein